MINYTLTRSKRKTVALYVRDGSVEVRAPQWLPKDDIERFVKSKESWVADRLARQHEQLIRREAFVLNYGSAVPFRGEECVITEKTGTRAGFEDNIFYMPPGLNPEQIKAICIQIYRRLAKIYLPKRVALYSQQMGVSPSSVKVTGAKTRWGSCSAKKSINFSWRLMMAADDVIDYVVVHELAHLIEMNHSPQFWEIVDNTLPHSRNKKALLKALQQRLAAEDWS